MISQRHLRASLHEGKIATTGGCVIGWVAKEDRDLVRVKASASIASFSIVTSIELHLQR